MSQLFKNNVDIDFNKILVFFDKYCNKTNKYYTLTKISYKKAMFNKDVEKIYEYIKPFYHKSKIFYIERPINYKNFITIIRQICKYNNTPIISKIKYFTGTYDLSYHIYYNIN